jgi:hypothetical protein
MAGGRSYVWGHRASDANGSPTNWEKIPRYLIRDRDRAYGEIFIPPGSVDRHPRPPDFSALTVAKCVCRTADRIDRQECVDHVVVFGERHLRHVLLSYMSYLQRHAHPFVIEQRRADVTRRRDSRTHSLLSDSGRTAPSIYPD